MINESNFHIQSKGNFTFVKTKLVHVKWMLLIMNGGVEIYSSPSGSKYIVLGDVLYRFSNHWGKVRNCHWTLGGHTPRRDVWVIGAIKFSALKENNRFSFYR